MRLLYFTGLLFGPTVLTVNAEWLKINDTVNTITSHQDFRKTIFRSFGHVVCRILVELVDYDVDQKDSMQNTCEVIGPPELLGSSRWRGGGSPGLVIELEEKLWEQFSFAPEDLVLDLMDAVVGERYFSNVGWLPTSISLSSRGNATIHHGAFHRRRQLEYFDRPRSVMLVRACSAGQARFVPFDVDNVVKEVRVSGISSAFTGRSLLVAANIATQTLLGVESLPDVADHVVFCMPPGTSGEKYLAAAALNSWYAVASDRWCAQPNAIIHEIGHNLGLGHAGKGDNAYADGTSLMGYSEVRADGPSKCFNGYNFWLLGWYPNHRIDLDALALTESVRVEIAAFTDFGVIGKNEVIIAKAGGLYLTYNRAETFNRETEDFLDTVTITKRVDGIHTKLLAGLSETNSRYISGDKLIFEVCSKHDGGSVAADKFIIGIGKEMLPCKSAMILGPDGVDATLSPPTRAPSMTPTLAPISTPTSAPPLVPAPTGKPVTPQPSLQEYTGFPTLSTGGPSEPLDDISEPFNPESSQVPVGVDERVATEESHRFPLVPVVSGTAGVIFLVFLTIFLFLLRRKWSVQARSRWQVSVLGSPKKQHTDNESETSQFGPSDESC
jgi:hypothetical protein